MDIITIKIMIKRKEVHVAQHQRIILNNNLMVYKNFENNYF